MRHPWKTASNRPVLMVLASDSKTPATGKTLAVKLGKNGGTLAAVSPTVTELSDGWYALALTAAHTDTLGALAGNVTAADCDPTDFLDEVDPAVNAARSMHVGAATGAVTASSLVDSGLTEATANHWVGRTLMLLSGTLARAATRITGFDGATQTLTFTAFPASPGAGVSYIII